MLARRLHCILDTHPQSRTPPPLPAFVALYSMHIVLWGGGVYVGHALHFYRERSNGGRKREFIENICMNEAEQRRKAAIREGCRCANCAGSTQGGKGCDGGLGG